MYLKKNWDDLSFDVYFKNYTQYQADKEIENFTLG